MLLDVKNIFGGLLILLGDDDDDEDDMVILSRMASFVEVVESG